MTDEQDDDPFFSSIFKIHDPEDVAKHLTESSMSL